MLTMAPSLLGRNEPSGQVATAQVGPVEHDIDDRSPGVGAHVLGRHGEVAGRVVDEHVDRARAPTRPRRRRLATASASLMSQAAASAVPPASSTAATPAARCFSSRLRMPTAAPRRPNSVAMALPRPVPPPVTTTTVPAKVPGDRAEAPRGGGGARPGGVTAREPRSDPRRRAGKTVG